MRLSCIDDDRWTPSSSRAAVHTRRVEWIRKDAPRSGFDRKLLYTLGSSLTVFRAERDGAAAKLEAALDDAVTPSSATAGPEIAVTSVARA